MAKYLYQGPVVNGYGVCIMNKWQSTTVAETESKATSNLLYRFKKTHNMTPTAKISLPGKLTIIG